MATVARYVPKAEADPAYSQDDPAYSQDDLDEVVGRFWHHDNFFWYPERIVELPSTEPGVQLIQWVAIAKGVFHGHRNKSVHQGYLIIHRTCAGGRLTYKSGKTRIIPKPLITIARVVVMVDSGYEVVAIRASEAIHDGLPITHEEAIAGKFNTVEDTTVFADLALRSRCHLNEVDADGLRIDPWRGPLACAVGWTANYV
jgi:hypothetical protein